MARPKTRSEKSTAKATRQLAYSHAQRCWKYRKRFPDTPGLDKSPLCLFGAKDYQSIVLARARSAGVNPANYSSHWYFELKTQPTTGNQAIKCLHHSNLAICLRTPKRFAYRHDVINKRVLEWLMVLRDETLLTYDPNSTETLANLERIARLTLKLPQQAHITTSMLLGLRLMGFDLANGALLPCLRLNLG